MSSIVIFAAAAILFGALVFSATQPEPQDPQ